MLPQLQIQAYGNQIEAVLDALRCLTPLSYDVLTFLIVERLASSSRRKLKQDGLNTSDWLQVRPPSCHFLSEGHL